MSKLKDSDFKDRNQIDDWDESNDVTDIPDDILEKAKTYPFRQKSTGGNFRKSTDIGTADDLPKKYRK